jgi:hypothetical protein
VPYAPWRYNSQVTVPVQAGFPYGDATSFERPEGDFQMHLASRFAIFIGLAALPAFAKGITVRFLPNPAEDSVVEYRILRAAPGLPPAQIGRITAAAGRDTFSFADTSAIKGLAYRYSIIGMDAGGGASDPSESTEVALPSLSLPDTLRADAREVRWTLALGADPLSGAAPLALSLEDSSHILLRYDAWTHQILFSPRGEAVPGWAVVRATYYGKFADRDSIWLAFDAVGIRGVGPSHAGWACNLPASWSPRQGSLRIRSAPTALGRAKGARAGTWNLLTVRGESVASLALPGNGSETLWDGRDFRGSPVHPAGYLWAERGPGGALLQAGSLRILP